MKRFSLKLSNLEVRSCNKTLTSNGEHVRAEIVVLSKDGVHCWTIAYWEKHKEGFDLRFVGNRFANNEVNKNDLIELMSFGQYKMDEYFRSSCCV